jgi:CheY-like chemotaxis protein
MAPTQANTDSAPIVYLVDDEELLLDLAEVALMGQGYRVKKFTDPTRALFSLAAESSQPALLLTDYAMTPINGLELCERCRKVWPDMKILLLSGTVDGSITQNARVKPNAFLPKPYLPSELAEIVRTLIR